MGHYIDGRFRLVTWCSKALTSTQRRYAMFFVAVPLFCWIRSHNVPSLGSFPAGQSLPGSRDLLSHSPPCIPTCPGGCCTSIPKAYVQDDQQFPWLPYPEFTPLNQYCIPGCGRDDIYIYICLFLDYYGFSYNIGGGVL